MDAPLLRVHASCILCMHPALACRPRLCSTLFHALRLNCCCTCVSGPQALAGIDILRKICNHPDLLERLTASASPDYGASCAA